MRVSTTFGSLLAYFCGVSILLAPTPVRARDRLPADPVEELTRALKTPTDTAAIEARLAAVRTLGDLRRALALDYKGETPKYRAQLILRFQEALRSSLKEGSVISRLAAITMVSELGVSVQGADPSNALGQVFTKDLLELVKDSNPEISAAAARALGKVAPDSKEALDALGKLLDSANPRQRLAGVEALLEILQIHYDVAFTGSKQAIRVDTAQLSRVSTQVIPYAAKGLRLPEPEVRKRSAEAMHQASLTLARYIRRYSVDNPGTLELSASDRKLWAPLVQSLAEHADAVVHGLRDSDAEVRRLAARTLENMGSSREVLERPFVPAPAPAKENRGAAEPASGPKLGLLPAGELQLAAELQANAQAVGEDPLLPALRKSIPSLLKALEDPDVRVRLAALDMLETLGTEAVSATPTLNKLLGDPNKFVRWSAARTLGKIGVSPVAGQTADGLIKLLKDSDLDLQLTASLALEKLGPAMRSAVPALVEALHAPDANLRIAAMRALVGIGRDAEPALPEITAALADKDSRVRRTAAEALARFGPAARPAIGALSETLKDSDPDVRKAASDALLTIPTDAGR